MHQNPFSTSCFHFHTFKFGFVRLFIHFKIQLCHFFVHSFCDSRFFFLLVFHYLAQVFDCILVNVLSVLFRVRCIFISETILCTLHSEPAHFSSNNSFRHFTTLFFSSLVHRIVFTVVYLIISCSRRCSIVARF